MPKKSSKKKVVNNLYKGDHVVFTGKGKLNGLEGLVISTDVDQSQDEIVYEVLFYDSEDETQDICARVMSSNLEKFEPELAYPPIFPYEDSIMLASGWNISLAWKIIRADRERVPVPRKFIESFYEQCFKGMDQPEIKGEDGWTKIPFSLIDVDKEKALSDKTDLSIPIIMVKMKSSHFPIDGRHRLYKAYHTNQPIDAYLLTEAEERAIKL